jgi:cytochrome c oxidase subunit IV
MADSTVKIDSHDHTHDHPTERDYVRLAIILTVITAVEVAIYYIDWMHDSGALVPTLIVLSTLKFVIVVAYYMHLKTDSAMFRWMFISGLVLALAVMAAVIALQVFNRIGYAFDFLP